MHTDPAWSFTERFKYQPHAESQSLIKLCKRIYGDCQLWRDAKENSLLAFEGTFNICLPLLAGSSALRIKQWAHPSPSLISVGPSCCPFSFWTLPKKYIWFIQKQVHSVYSSTECETDYLPFSVTQKGRTWPRSAGYKCKGEAQLVQSHTRAPSASGCLFSLLGGAQQRAGKHKHWGLVEFTQGPDWLRRT